MTDHAARPVLRRSRRLPYSPGADVAGLILIGSLVVALVLLLLAELSTWLQRALDRLQGRRWLATGLPRLKLQVSFPFCDPNKPVFLDRTSEPGKSVAVQEVKQLNGRILLHAQRCRRVRESPWRTAPRRARTAPPGRPGHRRHAPARRRQASGGYGPGRGNRRGPRRHLGPDRSRAAARWRVDRRSLGTPVLASTRGARWWRAVL
jgi:hypothetical protein